MTFDQFTNPDVERAAENIRRKFEAAFAEVERYLLAELGKLDRKEGILEGDAFNVARITNLLAELQAQLRAAGFGDLFKAQAAELRDLAGSVLAEAEEHGLPEEFTATTGQALGLLIRNAESELLATETTVARELEDLLARSAMGGVRWVDLAQAIAKKLDIHLSRAMAKATSTMASFHTQARVGYFSQPDEDGEPLAEWWLYDGPEDSRNRDWCGHFVGTRVTLEILDAHAESFGRTWPIPPRYSLGGPNCRHELIPLLDDFEQYEIGPR